MKNKIKEKFFDITSSIASKCFIPLSFLVITFDKRTNYKEYKTLQDYKFREENYIKYEQKRDEEFHKLKKQLQEKNKEIAQLKKELYNWEVWLAITRL